MQDGTLPYIARCVKQLFRSHFVDERIINRQFPTAWPPISSDLNLCNFWLWRGLKSMVYRDATTLLSDIKESLEHHVRNIPQLKLFSTV